MTHNPQTIEKTLADCLLNTVKFSIGKRHSGKRGKHKLQVEENIHKIFQNEDNICLTPSIQKWPM